MVNQLVGFQALHQIDRLVADLALFRLGCNKAAFLAFAGIRAGTLVSSCSAVGGAAALVDRAAWSINLQTTKYAQGRNRW